MAKKRTKVSKKNKSAQRRRPWTPREDAAIKGLVGENGIKQWTLIAESLRDKYNISGRSGKQCRERWHNHLNSGILKQPWSIAEEKVLFVTHQKIGNKWAEVSKFLPGRTDNSIKNHFYSTVRKYYRKISGKEGTAEMLRENLKEITNCIIKELGKDRQISNGHSDFPSDSEENSELFPDFSDMMITGQHINVPEDWTQLDYPFDDYPEVLIFPMSPNEYSSFFV